MILLCHSVCLLVRDITLAKLSASLQYFSAVVLVGYSEVSIEKRRIYQQYSYCSPNKGRKTGGVKGFLFLRKFPYSETPLILMLHTGVRNRLLEGLSSSRMPVTLMIHRDVKNRLLAGRYAVLWKYRCATVQILVGYQIPFRKYPLSLLLHTRKK